MKRINVLFAVIVSILFLTACTKEGETGPQGLQGDTGPAGDDGSLIHAGATAPNNELGVPGDYYLNKNTKELYGPKNEETGWGVPIILTGEKGDTGVTGEDGIDGSIIYAGTSAPSTDIGASGDFFLNKNTYDLYGPKTAGAWGTPINLKGTANVMYSAWVDANWNISNEATSKGMTIPVNQLTNNELSSSALVMVYLKQFGSSSVFPMPTEGRWDNTWYSYTFGSNVAALNQSIYIKLNSTDGVELTEYQYAAIRGNRFRYIIIPGSVLYSGTGSNKENFYNLNLSDYKEVEKYFGIQD